MTSYASFYVDDRLGGTSKICLGDERELMRVPDEVTHSVVFLWARTNRDEAKFGGTGFIVATPGVIPNGAGQFFAHHYLVTAKHNIDLALTDQGNLWARFNARVGGSVSAEVTNADWLYPEDDAVDVAVLALNTPPKGLELLQIPDKAFVTDAEIAKYRIGIGDELRITGLFTSRHGTESNLPILRSGMIASMASELLRDRTTGHEYRAYLAEVHSIGGLSGSPVFVYLPRERTPDAEGMTDTTTGRHRLLGLVRGHYEGGEDDIRNTGIAIVTPVAEVSRLLERGDVVSKRKEMDEKIHEAKRERGDGAVQDSSFQEDEFERFENLAEVLVNTPKPKAD